MLGGREAEAGSVVGRADPVNRGGSGRVCGGRACGGATAQAAGEPPGRGQQCRRGCGAPSSCFRIRKENANILSRMFLGTPSP